MIGFLAPLVTPRELMRRDPFAGSLRVVFFPTLPSTLCLNPSEG